MAKKQKKFKPKEVPTKHQLSRWQREKRIQRIIISVAAVFLVGVISYVGYSHYNNDVKPLHEIVIEVNDISFNMGYYVKMLDAQTRTVCALSKAFTSAQVRTYIEDAELMKQGANDLGIVVTTQEIDKEIEEGNELPNEKVYRDMVGAKLLGGKLWDYFDSQLPDKMEQARIQVMLVDGQNVANNMTAAIQSGGNFTALANDFSCNSKIQGDLGWLPEELMPSPLIWIVASSLEPGNVSSPTYDSSATKDVGYWLIEVTEKDEEKGIKARAILLGSRAEADEVKTKLGSGNFTSLAEEHSQHESKDNGGELGWLKQGDTGSDAFDRVAFELPLNEVSEPVKDESVQTKGGYWIVKVLDKGEHELSEEVKKGLSNNDFTQWFEEQRENNTINNYLDEKKKSWAAERVLEGR